MCDQRERDTDVVAHTNLRISTNETHHRRRHKYAPVIRSRNSPIKFSGMFSLSENEIYKQEHKLC